MSTDKNAINILAIPGSLREASLIRKLLFGLQPLAPEGVAITIFELHDIPLYNHDIEINVGFPPAVQAMREAIAASDGLIFATPEYNGSYSGVLKNSIDWASRQGLLAKRPVTPISGSPGALGATKAQEHLRAVLGHLGMYVMTRPSLAIPQLDKKIVDDVIIDEPTQKFIRAWLLAFQEWIIQLNK